MKMGICQKEAANMNCTKARCDYLCMHEYNAVNEVQKYSKIIWVDDFYPLVFECHYSIESNFRIIKNFARLVPLLKIFFLICFSLCTNGTIIRRYLSKVYNSGVSIIIKQYHIANMHRMISFWTVEHQTNWSQFPNLYIAFFLPSKMQFVSVLILQIVN